MSIFRRRAVNTSRTLTGVGTILSAAHHDKSTGKIHGHTWEVVAWFHYDGTDFAVRKYLLDQVVSRLDHNCLPDKIAWGEALARYIGDAINSEHDSCIAVDVNRPIERIYARWER